jgi:hypothetical protein
MTAYVHVSIVAYRAKIVSASNQSTWHNLKWHALALSPNNVRYYSVDYFVVSKKIVYWEGIL